MIKFLIIFYSNNFEQIIKYNNNLQNKSQGNSADKIFKNIRNYNIQYFRRRKLYIKSQISFFIYNQLYMEKHIFIFALLFTTIFTQYITSTGSSSNSCCVPKSTVTVGGTGTVNVVPDIATISITISVTAATSQLAQSNANVQVNAVLSALAKLNVANSDIQTSSLYISPQYNYTNNGAVLIGQQATQTITVTVKNIAPNGVRLGQVIDALTPINGITLSGINFGISNPAKANEKAQINAWNDAYTKARGYAQLSGLNLGKAISIVDNPITTSSPGPYFASAAKLTPTTISTGQLQVSSTVSVVFALN